MYFANQPRPTSEKIGQIAEHLDLKKNVVRVWFCNQRQKQKRMKFSNENGRNSDENEENEDKNSTTVFMNADSSADDMTELGNLDIGAEIENEENNEVNNMLLNSNL